jgi:hypothetical protein
MEGSASTKPSPITCAKWLDESTVVVSTKNGKVITRMIKEKN